MVGVLLSLFTTFRGPDGSGPETGLTELSEEELLARAIDYDERALGELYDRYEHKIFSYVYRRTNSQPLAEDLTAQVFLKMLEAIRKGKAWHSSFSGWLYRIAHNQIIDYYRRRERRNHASLDDFPMLPNEEDSPVRAAELKLEAERLRIAITRLTEEQAQVVILRFFEGYSISEVSAMMAKTEGAIKALQYRAVASLRKLMAEEQPA